MQRNHESRAPKKTKKELARRRRIREKFERERPSLEELQKSGKYARPIKQGDYLALMHLSAELRAARQSRSLSLADVSRISGIDKAAISRIESGTAKNPTMMTLARLARSLGMRLCVSLDSSHDSSQ